MIIKFLRTFLNLATILHDLHLSLVVSSVHPALPTTVGEHQETQHIGTVVTCLLLDFAQWTVEVEHGEGI